MSHAEDKGGNVIKACLACFTRAFTATSLSCWQQPDFIPIGEEKNLALLPAQHQ